MIQTLLFWYYKPFGNAFQIFVSIQGKTSHTSKPYK